MFLDKNGTGNPSPVGIELRGNVTALRTKADSSVLFDQSVPRNDAVNGGDIISTLDKKVNANSSNHMPHADDQSVIIDVNSVAKILLKGIDQDNDKIKFEVVSEPLMGVLVGFDKNTGTVTYVPNPGSDGTDRFTFKAVDVHNLQSNVAEVSVIVNAIQEIGPKLADVNAATFSNEPVIITVRASNHESGSYLKFDAVSVPLTAR